MEKQSEFPPRRRFAQYGFVEQTYLSLKEHNAITKLASETIEYWKSKAEGWQKDVAKLEVKLESAKEALRFYSEGKHFEEVDSTIIEVDGMEDHIVGKRARECLKKLEE